MQNCWPKWTLPEPLWRFASPRRLFFDTNCALCRRRGQPGIDLCVYCEKLFTPQFARSANGAMAGLCSGCGALTHIPATCADPQRWHYCSTCRHLGTPMFDSLVAPYQYGFPINALVQRLKYRSDRTIARVMGTLLASSVEQRHTGLAALPDMLLPMPMHSRRLRMRGYNHAQEIAHWCAKSLDLKLNPAAARRIVDTPALAGFGRAERQHHILGAFRASPVVNNRRIAIVDDVLTTGASSRELARELYDTGAISVELWVLARTSRPRESD